MCVLSCFISAVAAFNWWKVASWRAATAWFTSTSIEKSQPFYFTWFTEIGRVIRYYCVDHLCSLVKCQGHPPNLSVGFWIGLSCAHLPRSTKVALRPAALSCAEHRCGLRWHNCSALLTQKWHCTWRIFIDTPSAALSHPSWRKPVYQICKCTQRSCTCTKLQLHQDAETRLTPGRK